MTLVTTEQIVEALAGVMDPELGRSLVELGIVRDVRVQDGRVSFTVALTIPQCPLKDKLVAETRAAVLALDGIEEVEVDLIEMTAEEKQRIGISGTDQPGTAERFNRLVVSLDKQDQLESNLTEQTRSIGAKSAYGRLRKTFPSSSSRPPLDRYDAGGF